MTPAERERAIAAVKKHLEERRLAGAWTTLDGQVAAIVYEYEHVLNGLAVFGLTLTLAGTPHPSPITPTGGEGLADVGAT